MEVLLVVLNILLVIALVLLFIRNKKIKKEKEKAENANNSKGEFISNMSLEIRTQLNSIIGFSEDIQNNKDNINPKVSEDADYVLESSKRLLEIMDSILDIYKIENNNIEIKEEEYNLKEEIEQVISFHSTKLGGKPVNLKVNIPSNLPFELLGDKAHIKDIINNMVINAIKHIKQGDIVLSVACNNLDNNCILGISINNTDGSETVDDSKDIELTIAKRLVGMLNGKYSNLESSIMVELSQKISKLNPNLTPTVNVVMEKEANEDAQIKVPKAFGIAGKNVLIVDDNQLNIKVARRALEEFDFKIDECTDGQKCLEKIVNGNEYDLILMDIMMPNMSGEEAMAKLRENPNFKIPTIALTADADTGAKEKYLAEGFVDYIAKPFSKEQIQEKLEVVFDATPKGETPVTEVVTPSPVEPVMEPITTPVVAPTEVPEIPSIVKNK